MGLLDNLAKAGEKISEKAKEVASDENKEKAKNFFNSVGEKISETAKEVTSDENKAKAKEFFSNIGEKISETAKDVKEYVDEKTKEEPKAEVKEETVAECCSEECECSCKDKLLKVLKEEFPQYTVKEEVSPTTIGGTGKFMNYSLGIYNGETPKLFIMIIGKTTCSHREYRFSKEEAAKNGITMINFIEHYPNEISYINNRLHQYL